MSERPNMNAHDVTMAVVKTLFPYREWLSVPNSNQYLHWEADLLLVSPNNFLDEVEVKVNITDLRRDAKKLEKHRVLGEASHPALRKFWYAMPERVYAKVRPGDVPAYAGVITINDLDRASITREARVNKSARKLTDAEKFKLARLGVIRFWALKEKK
jgi:hypothetical protein